MADEQVVAGEPQDEGQQERQDEGRDYISRKDVDEMIAKATQSAADRVRTEYSQKLKDEQKKSMSETQRLAEDMKEIKQQLAEERQMRTKRELESYALRQLSERGIDAEWVDDVVGESLEATTDRIDRLEKRLAKREEKAKQDGYQQFVKESDRKPQKGEAPQVMSPDQWAKEMTRASRANDFGRIKQLREQQASVLQAALNK